MPAIGIPQYTERENRSLKRILDKLSASENRTETQYKRVRKHDRKDFQGQILVCLVSPEGPPPSEDHPTTFPAWAYNLSQGGIGFVALVPIVDLVVSIGLKRPDGLIRWMPGRVVRNRPIPEEDFIDYGVAFQIAAFAS